MRFSFLFLSILFCFSSCAQTDSADYGIKPIITSTKHKVGNRIVEIKQRRFEPAGNLLLLQLHHNETTAEKAAEHFLEKSGGTLINIENKGVRNLSFSISGKRYEFDPNRIFSNTGVKETLELYGTYYPTAASEIRKFAAAILQSIPDTAIVVALHNNTDERYSIESYKNDKVFQRTAKEVYQDEAKDKDDFFITTDSLLFERLKEKNHNVVLQDNDQAPDDGSLSIYFGKKQRLYVNIEAQVGHLKEQQTMLEDLILILQEISLLSNASLPPKE